LAISDQQWRTGAFGIPAKLRAVVRSEDDDGLKESMFIVWTALATASSTIKHLYSLVRESEILALADTFNMQTSDYGLSFLGTESYDEVVKRLGGCLRAMEREFTDWDLGSRPTDPNSWRVSHEEQSAFLIPMGRLAWRDPKNPEQDRRPFDQRGLPYGTSWIQSTSLHTKGRIWIGLIQNRSSWMSSKRRRRLIRVSTPHSRSETFRGCAAPLLCSEPR
jgi:hypothetical protein